MPKTPKSTAGQRIVILELYPEDISDTLLPGDLKLLKEKYGDKPCFFEVHFPWKEVVHHTWFVDDVYEKYDNTHEIVRKRKVETKSRQETI